MIYRTTAAVALALIAVVVTLFTLIAPGARAQDDLTIATGDGLTLTLSPDGLVTGLTVDGAELVSSPAPAVWIRDMSAAGDVTEPNLVANPGFEDGISGWGSYFNGGVEVAVTTTVAHGGVGSVGFSQPLSDTSNFAAIVSDAVPVTPGQRYRVSAWWRSGTGYLSALGGPPTMWQMELYRDLRRTNALYVEWLDGGGQPLGLPELAVALHWNAANWRLIRRELTAPPEARSARVVIGVRLRGETIWVDDVTFVPSPEVDVAVGGTVSRVGGQLVQTAQVGPDLSVTVIYSATGESIAVHGQVQDASGSDRALEVAVALPVALTPLPPTSSPLSQGRERGEEAQGVRGEGWTWWDDAHTARPITGGVRYEHVISAIFDGYLPMSLYPYAGIEDGARGLALALPLDDPQIANLAYDAGAGQYETRFHLGISPLAAKPGGVATFDLMIYRFDPAWGFRAVIEKHAQLHPGDFDPSVSMYDYASAEQGFFFGQWGASVVAQHDAANIYSTQYTVGELPVKVSDSSEPRPTLDQALAAVEALRTDPKPVAQAYGEAIVNSAAHDTNGDWVLKHVGIYEWDPEHWEASWTANLDPELTGGLADWIIAWRVDPAFRDTEAIGAHLDGVQIDNFMSTPAIDFHPEALAVADHSLTYSPHTYRPGVHTGSAMWSYLAYLRRHIDGQWGTDRGLSINFWGLGHPNYLAPFLDGLGGEGNTAGGAGTNWTPEILDYRRAVAYHRPLLFANQTSGLTLDDARSFSQRAMLYGVRPRRGPNGSGWEPEVEQVISDTQTLVQAYWGAGWEPATHAWGAGSGVWVERFGRWRAAVGRRQPSETDSLKDGLYFTVMNTLTETLPFTLTIDAEGLGINRTVSLTITELVSGEVVSYSAGAGLIQLSGVLAGEEARVYALIGGPAPCGTIEGDVDCDCDVDVDDVTTIVARWGQPPTGGNADYDLNEDDVIDILDVMIVARNWGEACGIVQTSEFRQRTTDIPAYRTGRMSVVWRL